MRKFICFFLASMLCFSIPVISQISSGGFPPSFEKKLKSQSQINVHQLKRIDNINELLLEDKKHPDPFRYAIQTPVEIDIKNHGTLTMDNEGNRIWQYAIESPNAHSINLTFTKYFLPEGAKLWIYTPEQTHLIGAFTSFNNKENHSLTIQDVPGNKIMLEYLEPGNTSFEGELVIGKIGQAYKDLFETVLKISEESNIDINCPEGDLWQQEKHAVAKMTFSDDNGGYLCSGALINNTNNDGTPYFLTANHCISTLAQANTLITYFNYEKDDCNGVSLPQQTLSGASLKASGTDTDFTLLLLSEQPPPSYQPYFAGWNRSADPPSAGIAIHHPRGDVKKISIDLDTLVNHPSQVTIQGDNSNISIPANHLWTAIFDYGITEQGSSGSPIFNTDGQIVGSLSLGTEDNDALAWYGKFSLSWDKVFEVRHQLKHWLDPSQTNPVSHPGYFYPDSTYADASFTTEFTDVCTNEPVYIKNISLFNPENYEWVIRPETYEFLEGHDENSKNLGVIFTENDEYSITLTAEKNGIINEQPRRNYIKAGNLRASLIYIEPNTICKDTYQNIFATSKGGDYFDWFIDEKNENLFEINYLNNKRDSILFNLIEDNLPDSSVYTSLYTVAYHGTCTDTTSIEIAIVQQINDNIFNAISLGVDEGYTGPYSNECATTQENEPYPVIGNCEEQGFWCDCNVGPLYLDNSIWFDFIGPESGVVSIETRGFDNQIAVYDATTPEDILSGDSTLYTIIGANDDYPGKEDFSATIPALNVEPGKKYWIQSDGS
ncbi:MAG: trypsin-like serine peptidase, partial [Bacteroidota bacterium]